MVEQPVEETAVSSFKKAIEVAREARAAQERRVLSDDEKRELLAPVAGR